MTINKTITQTDELRPNCVSAELKAAWVLALDGRLRTEVLSQPLAPLTYPEDADTELAAAEPYGELYTLWCAALLDLTAGDTVRYANTMAAFEQLLDAFSRQSAKASSLPDGGFRNVRL